MENYYKLMSTDRFEDFMEFVKENPNFTNMKCSPKPEAWVDFYEAMQKYDYIRGMLSHTRCQQVNRNS